MSIIGDRLRTLRKSKGLTLKDVYNATGISVSGLSDIERGENNCNSTTLQILANFYGVSTDYISGNSDNKKDNNVDVAFYNQFGELTPEQKKEIENFVAFIKARDSK